MTGRVSVVIPTHNTRELTLRCLCTLGKEVGSAVEIVLVDDGSHDGTAEAVLVRHPSVRVVRHDTARGFTDSANDGLSRAGGDILLLLNSDTEVEEDSLPRLVEAFRASPRLGVASPRLLNPDGSPQWSGGRTPTLPWLFLLASGPPGRARRRARLPPPEARPLGCRRPDRLGHRGGHGNPPPDLGGRGPPRHALPFLRPGPRLLPSGGRRGLARGAREGLARGPRGGREHRAALGGRAQLAPRPAVD